MRTVMYETERAVFKFNLPDVEDRLRHYANNHNVDDASRLLTFLSNKSSESIEIPKDSQYFGYIILDLLNAGKGSVTCKLCNRTYKPHQLKPTTVGHGESPFSINPQPIERRFFKRKRNPSALGGKGYECPEGHELLSAVITWRT